ncbi:translation initiation factor 2 [Actinoplanes sp. NPDC048796]|uniref:translation initiation factor 2 n=1 Tax=Actinoplanes sp. NPDC048796 TaxID=3155640 RepID=UPI00340CA12B
MSSPTGVPDDSYWQRPDPDSPVPGPAPEPSGTAPKPEASYPGPPRPTPPSPHWRPPTISQPPPPRSMPGQDMDALDESEGSARTVTYGVGLVAGAIALILMCLLCARVIF